MRIGLDLRSPLPGGNGSLAAAIAEARAAEDAGFDVLWVDGPSSMAVAAALAPHLRSIAVGVVVALGADHPIYSVEEAALVDQLLGGRLVTCLRPAPGSEDGGDRFTEAVDLVLAGFAPRPFRHEGAAWRAPANLPDNVFNIESRMRVTPTTAQIEPVLWVTGGPVAMAVAAGHALSYVAGDPAEGAEAWPVIESALGRRALRLRRPARWPVTGSADDLDIYGLADDLSVAQRDWGLDTAILTLPDSGREEMISRIAHDVRPRVQLDRLPPGLSEYWDGRMAARMSRPTRATGGDDG